MTKSPLPQLQWYPEEVESIWFRIDVSVLAKMLRELRPEGSVPLLLDLYEKVVEGYGEKVADKIRWGWKDLEVEDHEDRPR